VGDYGQSTRELYRVSAITATPTFTAQNDGNGARKGGHFVIDVTAGATLSIVPTIDGQDPSSGKWYNILTGVAITAVGTTVLRIYPGLAAAANLAVSDVLPSVWRLVMTHGNANAATYTVSARLFD
jgi:hypothetical protein